MKERSRTIEAATCLRVAKRVAGFAYAKAQEALETRQDKSPQQRQAAGQDLLRLLLQHTQPDGRLLALRTPGGEQKRESSSCPYLISSNGFESDILLVNLDATPVGTRARLTLYQMHVKSWQDVLSSTRYRIAPDGVTEQQRTHVYPVPSESIHPNAERPTLSRLSDIRLLTNVVETGEQFEDPDMIDDAISDYHRRAAKYLPPIPEQMPTQPYLRIVS